LGAHGDSAPLGALFSLVGCQLQPGPPSRAQPFRHNQGLSFFLAYGLGARGAAMSPVDMARRLPATPRCARYFIVCVHVPGVPSPASQQSWTACWRSWWRTRCPVEECTVCVCVRVCVFPVSSTLEGTPAVLVRAVVRPGDIPYMRSSRAQDTGEHPESAHCRLCWWRVEGHADARGGTRPSYGVVRHLRGREGLRRL